MSVTKGLKERMDRWKREEVQAIQIQELRFMLKKHEYSNEGYCPECGMSEFHGHDLDCQLAKLLEGCDE